MDDYKVAYQAKNPDRCIERSWKALPIADGCLDDGERCDRRRVGAQDAWPERDRGDEGQGAQLPPLGVGKAALGSNQQPELLLRNTLKRRQRIVGGSILVAKNQPPVALPARQQAIEPDRIAHLGN